MTEKPKRRFGLVTGASEYHIVRETALVRKNAFCGEPIDEPLLEPPAGLDVCGKCLRIAQDKLRKRS